MLPGNTQRLTILWKNANNLKTARPTIMKLRRQRDTNNRQLEAKYQTTGTRIHAMHNANVAHGSGNESHQNEAGRSRGKVKSCIFYDMIIFLNPSYYSLK